MESMIIFGALLGTAGIGLAADSTAAESYAANPTITADCTVELADASIIGSFMGGACVIGMGIGLKDMADPSAHPIVNSWRHLGLKYVDFDDFNMYNIISRDPQGNLQYDWTEWDRALHIAYRILHSTPTICLCNRPRVVSSWPDDPKWDSWAFMPSSLDEWYQIWRTTVEHTMAWGDERGIPTRGLHYGMQYEVDCGPVDSFPGTCIYSPDDPNWEANSMDLTMVTYNAVHDADPTARIGAPGHMTWGRNFSRQPDLYTWLRNFIPRVHEWNAAHPGDDFSSHFYVLYDEYDFMNVGLAADGVVATREYLAEMDFPGREKIEILFDSGGGGNWSINYNNPEYARYPWRVSSYIARNILHEFRDGSSGVTRASWYFFASGHTPTAATDPNPNALVQFEGSGGPGDNYHYKPAYAAFEIANLLQQERKIVRSNVSMNGTNLGGNDLEAIAVYSNDPPRVRVVINNHNGVDAADVHLRVKLPDSFPDRGSIYHSFQRVDETHSTETVVNPPTLDSSILEPVTASNTGQVQVRGARTHYVEQSIPTIPAYGTLLITLTPTCPL